MSAVVGVPEEMRYCYIVVRRDLSDGKRAAMVAHVALEVGTRQATTSRQFVVVLLAKDEAELRKFAEDYGPTNAHLYYEPDMKEHTAFAAWGLYGEERAKFKKLPLWRDS